MPKFAVILKNAIDKSEFVTSMSISQSSKSGMPDRAVPIISSMSLSPRMAMFSMSITEVRNLKSNDSRVENYQFDFNQFEDASYSGLELVRSSSGESLEYRLPEYNFNPNHLRDWWWTGSDGFDHDLSLNLYRSGSTFVQQSHSLSINPDNSSSMQRPEFVGGVQRISSSTFDPTFPTLAYQPMMKGRNKNIGNWPRIQFVGSLIPFGQVNYSFTGLPGEFNPNFPLTTGTNPPYDTPPNLTNVYGSIINWMDLAQTGSHKQLKHIAPRGINFHNPQNPIIHNAITDPNNTLFGPTSHPFITASGEAGHQYLGYWLISASMVDSQIFPDDFSIDATGYGYGEEWLYSDFRRRASNFGLLAATTKNVPYVNQTGSALNPLSVNQTDNPDFFTGSIDPTTVFNRNTRYINNTHNRHMYGGQGRTDLGNYTYHLDGTSVDYITVEINKIDVSHNEYKNKHGDSRFELIHWGRLLFGDDINLKAYNQQINTSLDSNNIATELSSYPHAVNPNRTKYLFANTYEASQGSRFYTTQFGGDHMTAVHSLAGGKVFGWAKNASLYCMNVNAGYQFNVDTMQMESVSKNQAQVNAFNAIRLFHLSKSIIDPTTGKNKFGVHISSSPHLPLSKRPTVVNTSYGSFLDLGRFQHPGLEGTVNPSNSVQSDGKSHISEIFYSGNLYTHEQTQSNNQIAHAGKMYSWGSMGEGNLSPALQFGFMHFKPSYSGSTAQQLFGGLYPAGGVAYRDQFPIMNVRKPMVDAALQDMCNVGVIHTKGAGNTWAASYRAPSSSNLDTAANLDSSKIRPHYRSKHYENYWKFDLDADDFIAGDPIHYMRGNSPQCQDTILVSSMQKQVYNLFNKGRKVGQAANQATFFTYWEIPKSNHGLGGGIDILHYDGVLSPGGSVYSQGYNHPEYPDFKGLGTFANEAGFSDYLVQTSSAPGYGYTMFGNFVFNTNNAESSSHVPYGGWSGTSFSGPQVAGMACLYLQINPEAKALDFKKFLNYWANPCLVTQSEHQSGKQDHWMMRGQEGVTATNSNTQYLAGSFYGEDVDGKRYSKSGPGINPRGYGLTTQSAAYWPYHSPFKTKKRATFRRK